MQLIIDDKEIRTLEQIKQFVDSIEGMEFSGLNIKEKYIWTGGVKEVQVSVAKEKRKRHTPLIH